MTGQGPFSFEDLSDSTTIDPFDAFEFGVDLNANSGIDTQMMGNDMLLVERLIWRPEMGIIQNMANLDPQSQIANQPYRRENYDKMIQICVYL